jgi:hypothetical protein
MGYLEMFDEDYIDSIDKWVKDNDADVNNLKSVSFRKVKQDLETEFKDDTNE